MLTKKSAEHVSFLRKRCLKISPRKCILQDREAFVEYKINQENNNFINITEDQIPVHSLYSSKHGNTASTSNTVTLATRLLKISTLWGDI